METMLVNKIKNGIVIDHIKAGFGVQLYRYLGLDKADFTVALITNAASEEMGKKDILKIQDKDKNDVDFDVLGLIDPNCTVNIIVGGKIVEKRKLRLPEKVEDVILCKNPRCITSTEKVIPHVFHLHDADEKEYACGYCEEVVKCSEVAAWMR